MEVGLQAGNEDTTAPLLLLDQFGVNWARLDVTDGTPSGLERIVTAFQTIKCKPLFLLRDVSKAELLMNLTLGVLHNDRWAMEIYNEPNYNNIDVDTYVRGVSQVRDDARARGFTGLVIAGGIGNLNKDGINYLSDAYDQFREGPRMPDDVVLGFHRYQPGTQVGLFGDNRRTVAWKPFSYRAEEIKKLVKIARGRMLACTEFGYHTATERVWFWDRRLTNEQARDNLYADFQFYNQFEEMLMAIVYQYNDGPTVPETGQPIDNFMHRFGIVTGEGQLKPQADAFRRWRDEGR